MGVDNSSALKQVSLMIHEPSLTQLGSWRLTAVLNVTVATWMGNAAAVLRGTGGSVTTPCGAKTSGARPKTPRGGQPGRTPRTSGRPSNALERAQAVRWA